ncbi:hypothetical protein [Pseudomonas typographi]|uniref:hypothetical protein n=1 Tax=Pseudomonas typographi TaxID=2715964 RepID=UPI0016877CF7|nr:hypothetical protein [Pseudomonas typographi]MBD1587080.1 hypothetical protein [Pseudomonas typographi]
MPQLISVKPLLAAIDTLSTTCMTAQARALLLQRMMPAGGWFAHTVASQVGDIQASCRDHAKLYLTQTMYRLITGLVQVDRVCIDATHYNQPALLASADEGDSRQRARSALEQAIRQAGQMPGDLADGLANAAASIKATLAGFDQVLAVGLPATIERQAREHMQEVARLGDQMLDELQQRLRQAAEQGERAGQWVVQQVEVNNAGPNKKKPGGWFTKPSPEDVQRYTFEAITSVGAYRQQQAACRPDSTLLALAKASQALARTNMQALVLAMLRRQVSDMSMALARAADAAGVAQAAWQHTLDAALRGEAFDTDWASADALLDAIRDELTGVGSQPVQVVAFADWAEA